MRTNPIRHVFSAALLVTLMTATALAQQPVFRGKVVDEKGAPVAGAEMVFSAQFQSLTRSTKTDSKGEFLMVGLPSGEFLITTKKEGVGEDQTKTRVTQGQNAPVTLTLRPAAAATGPIVAAPTGGSAAANKEAQALQALAKIGSEHLNAGRYAEAEAAFKKAVELKPDHAGAHAQLAAVYNAQRKFDLAAEASAKAAQLAGAAGPAGGGNAEALYNQGVVLFNGQKFTEAKAAFEAATKADPNLALAHYQLGMTALNLGDFALAVSSLEKYLSLDPNGPKAAEVKASLPALKGMVKK